VLGLYGDERARRDEALLTERVALARAHGPSWNRIAVALGVFRQATRQRFGGKVGAQSLRRNLSI
jgi:hypothetical protein